MTEPTLEEIRKARETRECPRCHEVSIVIDTCILGNIEEWSFICCWKCDFKATSKYEGKLEERERIKKELLEKIEKQKKDALEVPSKRFTEPVNAIFLSGYVMGLFDAHKIIAEVVKEK